MILSYFQKEVVIRMVTTGTGFGLDASTIFGLVSPWGNDITGEITQRELSVLYRISDGGLHPLSRDVILTSNGQLEELVADIKGADEILANMKSNPDYWDFMMKLYGAAQNSFACITDGLLTPAEAVASLRRIKNAILPYH